MNADRPITEDDLHAYVDGALDPVRRTQVDAYLDRDSDAASRVEKFTRQRSALRAALAPYAEEAIPPELSLARLVRQRRRAKPSLWQKATGFVESRRAPIGASWQMAAAALVLFASGGASGWALRPISFSGSTAIRPLAQEAADSYRLYEPDRIHPVEIKADDSDELVDWVSSRLQRRVSVPKQVSGFRLMGGRVVSTSRGPAAMFMYDNSHGVRVVIMVCPNTVHSEAPMAEDLQGELGSVSWSQHNMGYSLVGAASAEKLHPLADEMRRGIEGRA